MNLVDWKQTAAGHGAHTTTMGHVQVIEAFPMPQLRTHRRIWVYLPPDYATSGKRYPVLYMQDGQNLFDAATSYVGEWKVDKLLDELFYRQRLPGLIVVGIDNGAERRFDEYIPARKGRAYARFVANHLKPFIDRHFRTCREREHTGVAGSSLGGLISLYIGNHYSDLFAKVGAFSPAMRFAGSEFRSIVKSRDMKIYLDVGTKETLPYMEARRYADAVWHTYYDYVCAGYGDDQLKLVVDKDAPHHEDAWSKRFQSAVLWLFSTEPIRTEGTR